MVWRVVVDNKYPEYYTYRGEAAQGSALYDVRKTVGIIDDWILANLVFELEGKISSEGGIPLRVIIKTQERSTQHDVQVTVYIRADEAGPLRVQIASMTIILSVFAILAVAIALWILGHTVGEVKSIIWGPGGDQPWIPIAFLVAAGALLVTAVSRFKPKGGT